MCVVEMGEVVVCVVWGLVGERGWLLAGRRKKTRTDSLKVDGVAKVLSREAGFQLGQ